MKDMIRTLHPEKKQGVNINKEKYEIIRKAILSTLHTQKEISFIQTSSCLMKTLNTCTSVKCKRLRKGLVVVWFGWMPL